MPISTPTAGYQDGKLIPGESKPRRQPDPTNAWEVLIATFTVDVADLVPADSHRRATDFNVDLPANQFVGDAWDVAYRADGSTSTLLTAQIGQGVSFNLPSPARSVNDFSTPLLANTTRTFAPADFANAYSGGPSGGVLQGITITSLPAHGTLSLGGNTVQAGEEIPASDLGSLSYTPAAGFVGSDSFGWNGTDGVAYADSPALVDLTVTADPLPTLNNTKIDVSTTYPFSHAFSLQDFASQFSDSMPGQSLQSITVLSLPSGGLELNGQPVEAGEQIPASELASLTYLPASFSASSFTWSATDTLGLTSLPATIEFTSNGASNTGFALTGACGAALPIPTSTFTAHYADSLSGPLQAILITALPASGVLTLNGSALTAGEQIGVGQLSALVYTPSAGFSGADAFAWIAFDGTDYSSSPARVAITVDPPLTLAPGFAFSTPARTPHSFTAAEFAGELSGGSGTLQSITILSLPNSGTLTLNGLNVSASQIIPVSAIATLVYSPNAGFSGAVSFTWAASDGIQAAAAATVNITVQPPPLLASNFGFATQSGSPHQFSPTDFAGELSGGSGTLQSITILSLPNSGTLTLNGVNVAVSQIIPVNAIAGLISPINAGCSGSDSFIWSATDGVQTAAAAVNVTIQPPLLIASNIGITTPATSPHDFSLADFTSQLSGGSGTLQGITVLTLPASGTLTLNGLNVSASQVIPASAISGLVYTPSAGFSGSDSFTWSACDGVQTTPASSVNITVQPPEDPPIPVVSTDPPEALITPPTVVNPVTTIPITPEPISFEPIAVMPIWFVSYPILVQPPGQLTLISSLVITAQYPGAIPFELTTALHVDTLSPVVSTRLLASAPVTNPTAPSVPLTAPSTSDAFAASAPSARRQSLPAAVRPLPAIQAFSLPEFRAPEMPSAPSLPSTLSTSGSASLAHAEISSGLSAPLTSALPGTDLPAAPRDPSHVSATATAGPSGDSLLPPDPLVPATISPIIP